MKIEEFALFSGCCTSTIESVIAASSTQYFGPSEVVMAAGEDSGMVGFLCEGRLTVRSTSGVIMRHLRAGSVFGAGGAECGFSLSTVTADKSSCVCLLPMTALLEAVKSDGALAENYIRFMSGRVKLLNTLLAAYSAGNVVRKVATFLLAFYCDQPLYERPSMVELAQMLAIGRASLYRVLDSLECSGVITRNRCQITVTDQSALIKIIKGEK